MKRFCTYLCIVGIGLYGISGYSQGIAIVTKAGTEIKRITNTTKAFKELDVARKLVPPIRPSATARPFAFENESFSMADAVFDRLIATQKAAAKKEALNRLVTVPTVTPKNESSVSCHAWRAYQRHQTPQDLQRVFGRDMQLLARLTSQEELFCALEIQLFDLLTTLEKQADFPPELLLKMKEAFVKISLAGRVRWPQVWENISADTARWPFVESIQAAENAPAWQFEPDMVVIVINDDEGVAISIVNKLLPYAGTILSAYDIADLRRVMASLKYRNLRPHYIISDGMIGRHVTDKDIKQEIIQTFPELADSLGFILVSDSFLGAYARNNGYVSFIHRYDDRFTDFPSLLAYLEEKYHIQQVINQIPAAQQP